MTIDYQIEKPKSAHADFRIHFSDELNFDQHALGKKSTRGI